MILLITLIEVVFTAMESRECEYQENRSLRVRIKKYSGIGKNEYHKLKNKTDKGEGKADKHNEGDLERLIDVSGEREETDVCKVELQFLKMPKITNKKLKTMIKVKFEGDCEGYEVGFLVKDASNGSVIEFVKIDKFLLEELQWGLKVKFLLPCSYVCDISLVSKDTSGDSTQTSSMIYRCYPTSGTVMVNNK